MKRGLRTQHAAVLVLASLFLLLFSDSKSQPNDESVTVDHRLQILPHCYVKKIPIVVVAYLPTNDGVNLDADITGIDPNNPNIVIENMKQHILRSTIQAKYMLEEGSRFRGYDNPHASSYIGYEVIEYIFVYDNFELGKQVWWNTSMYRPDYFEVMNRIDGEHLVNDLGVREVWLWGGHHEPIEPAESNMSSPLTGDISNSERYNDDLPIYDHTYILYNYNYNRTANEAVHNQGHQIEAQLRHVNHTMFYEEFCGWDGTGLPLQRAGDTHYPPNSPVNGYDYSNQNLVWSDIEDWQPGGGTQKLLNAQTWYDLNYDWPDNFASPGIYDPHWYMFWWQNIPGNGNIIPYEDQYITNWWKIVYEWEDAISNQMNLFSDEQTAEENCNFTRY